MGVRIRLPGVLLVVVAVAAAAFLFFYRQDWNWVQMGVLGAVAAVGALRTLRGA